MTTQNDLNALQPGQKNQIKYMLIINGNHAPSYSGSNVTVYDRGGIRGDLNLAQFPNLAKLGFYNNIFINDLDSIDISENKKLCRIIIGESGNNNPFKNSSCIFSVKARQINRIITHYYVSSQSSYSEEVKTFKNQTAVPYCLVEDQRLEQLETEVEGLKRVIVERDQQIKDLLEKTSQTPTLDQFQELNNIALPGSKLDFSNLKHEIKRLKVKDFAPYFRQKKEKFDQLTVSAENKAGDSLRSILELFLQTQKKIAEAEKDNENSLDFTQGQLLGQLTTCQTLLQTKITQEELQTLLSMQKEILKLEKQLDSLQIK